MEGLIINYRRGVRNQVMNQMVIVFPEVNDKAKAKTLIGKTVTYTCEGKAKKQIKGKISSTHGGKGAVRAIFETGMPGQSVGHKVKVN